MGHPRLALTAKVLVVAALVLTLALGGPAGAKGLWSVSLRVSGPHLSAPILIPDHARFAGPLIPSLFNRYPPFGAPHRPGPRYVIEYDFRLQDGSDRQVAVSQYLYPYASGGPAVHTPTGQELRVFHRPWQIAAGWQRIPASIVWGLEERGLSRTSPATRSTGDDPAWLYLAVSCLILAAIIGGSRLAMPRLDGNTSSIDSSV